MATSSQTFQSAQQRRACHPLRSGEYKLKETHNQLKSISDEVRRIADMKNNSRNPEYKKRLRHCTSEDCGNWLKGLPKTIAELMGYNVLPAIDALVGDGISNEDAQQIKSGVLTRINDLVRGCDSAKRLLKGGISIEYNNFKRGDSILAELTDEAESIVDDILRETRSILPFMRSTKNPSISYASA